MRLLDRLQARYGRYGIPNLTLVIILGQVLAYVLMLSNQAFFLNLQLIPAKVLEGEVWRLLTFLFTPPVTNPVFAFFFWYLFFLMGSTLEHTWGSLRYNVFLLVGYVATLAVAFLTPQVPASVGFLQGSVFLAFAFLYPDFQLMLFFILPVKIKWIALLTWIGYSLMVVLDFTGSGPIVLASVANFFLFFWRDVFDKLRYGRRRMATQAERITQRDRAFHRCTVCGITDKTHPQMEFRYCSQCAGHLCYCMDHLRAHEHVVAPDTAPHRVP